MPGGRFNLRGTLLVLALAAMMMRAVVPPGFMPAAADGRLVVTLCHGEDSVTIDLGGGAGQDADKSGHALDRHGPCVLAAPYRISFTERALSASVHVGAGLAAPPPPSRGPPLLI